MTISRSTRGIERTSARRVGMGGMAEQRAHRRHLDHLAGVHHGDPLAGRGDHAEIVGDQQDRGAGARPARAADRGCGRRSRHRGRSSARRRSAGAARWPAPSRSSPAGTCRRRTDARTGAPAARARGCRQREHLQRSACGSRPATRRHAAEQAGDLPADGDQGVERGPRGLRDHRDPRAAIAAARPRERRQVAAVERMLPPVGGRACASAAGSPSRSRSCPSPTRRRGPGSRLRASKLAASTASISPWSLAKWTLRSRTSITDTALTASPACADRASRAARRRPG